MFYKQILSEYQELEKQINDLQQELKTLHNQIYIPKSNRKLAVQLATKKYLTLLTEYLSKERIALASYLKLHRANKNKATELLSTSPEYQSLLSLHFNPISQELSDWMHSPYEHNPKFPERLIHKSSSGNLVRSKSEAIIDMFLYLNRIPFRYECALELETLKFYPDFTIRHPKTGTFYYWEHFGLMDDPTYARNTFSKLQLYSSHGIIPSIHLITTYETQDNPLTMEVVDKIINHYFL